MKSTKVCILLAAATAFVIGAGPAQAAAPSHTSWDLRQYVAFVHDSIPMSYGVPSRTIHSLGDSICRGFDKGVTVYDMLAIVEPEDALDIEDMSYMIAGAVSFLCPHEQHHIDDIES